MLHEAVPAAGFHVRVPDHTLLPVEYVSVCAHGSVGTDAESGQKTYASRALFDGFRRIATALFSPASASA